MTARQSIKSDMLRRIRTGEWPVGSCMPTLDRLETQYAYSRRTISLAIGELTSQGILGTRGKAGTMVFCAPGQATIGILVNYGFSSRINAQFVVSISELLRDALSRNGHEVRIYHETPGFLGSGATPCDVLLEDVQRNMLAGLVTVSSNLPEWERRHPTERLTIPIVNISYHQSPYRVYVDFHAGVEAGIAALRQGGRRRVGMIGSPIPGLPEWFQRQAGAAGLETHADWMQCREVEATDEGYGFEALHAIWRRESRPDGLFVFDDIAAKGVAQAALSLGIGVPEELLLVYQKNEGADHFYPCPMTCTLVPLAQMAARATDLLRKVIEDRDTPPADIRIKPHYNATPDYALKEVTHA